MKLAFHLRPAARSRPRQNGVESACMNSASGRFALQAEMRPLAGLLGAIHIWPLELRGSAAPFLQLRVPLPPSPLRAVAHIRGARFEPALFV